MGRKDRADLPAMGNEGSQVRARRERLGMGIKDLAREAKVSRDTLSDLESGAKDFRQATLGKVLSALDRIETEAGLDAPVVEPTERDIIEFEVSGDFGVRVVVRGPVADVEALERSVERLIRNIGEDRPKD